MTIWHLHNLNARHALTPVLPEIRAAARQAVALAGALADIPDFDLVVRARPDGGAPEWGIDSGCAAPGVIEMAISPARFDDAAMVRALVRHMYQLIRQDGAAARGRGLGEALVGEGLAAHFTQQALGGRPDPWDAAVPSSGLARRAMHEWSRLGWDRDEWFLGRGKMRKWSGYGLGQRLVAEHLAQNPGEDAVTLARLPADAFRAAIRALAKADGDAPEDDDAATPDTDAEGARNG